MEHKMTAEIEREVMDKARELTAGLPPEFNMAPTIELVRQALLMGYDVVPRERGWFDPIPERPSK